MPKPIVADADVPTSRRPHWIAATFYLVLAVAGVVAAISGQPSALLATLACGLYSAYLYRGGRFVIWFW